MTYTLKIRRVGGSFDAIFPKEILDEIHLGGGDELTVLRVGTDLRLVPRDPQQDRVTEAFEVFRKEYRKTLRKLGE